MAEIHGQAGSIADCSLLDSGPRGNTAQDFAVKSGPLFRSEVGIILGMVGNGKPGFCSDQVMGLKAGLDLQKVAEAADQKSGTDQEDKGERNF